MALRAMVEAARQRLETAGLTPGGTVALWLAPSLGYVATLLAAWRIGGQVSLLDHRLTRAEVDRALIRLTPQILVEAAEPSAGTALRGYAEVEPVATALAADATVEKVREHLALEVAAYKLPRHLRVLPALPRTATGKILRDVATLRAAAPRTRAQPASQSTRVAQPAQPTQTLHPIQSAAAP